MTIFDLTHAYQPFQSPEFVPPWVEQNLTEIFLPLSRAMKKGVIKRGLQLQGWTIEAWLAAADPIRKMALEVLGNLKEANQKGNIELGVSGYAHPILPLLSDEVIKRQVKEDLAVVEKHLGKPTWFWFPEGAADKRSLTILHKVAPDLAVVTPDGCLGKGQFSGFVQIKFEEGSYQRTIVCNTLLKDIFMNAEDYKDKPEYVPKKLDWGAALQAAHSGEDFRRLLDDINVSEDIVLARDLENAGSKYGLVELEKGVKEVKGLKEAGLNLTLLTQVNWEDVSTVGIDDIKASSWEPRAESNDPYPYWVPVHPPQALRETVRAWGNFVEVFNRSYRSDFPKESLIVLASDVPWHFLGKKEWRPNPRHSAEFTQKVILPIVKEIGVSDLSAAADELSKAIGRFMKHGT